MLNVTEKATVTRVAFTADATAVRASAEKKIGSSGLEFTTRLCDIATGLASELPVAGRLMHDSLVDHPSGHWTFGLCRSGELAAFHLPTGQTVLEPIGAHLSHLAITPDGKTLLFGWCGTSQHDENGYASRTWAEPGTFGPGFRVGVETTGILNQFRRTCCGLAPLADGERFATLNWHMFSAPRLAVRSVATGAVLATTPIAAREYPILTAARDGTRVAVAVTRSIFVFDTADLAPLCTVKNDGRKHFTGIAFHPSGRFLAATSNDATVKLYDTTTRELARTFTWDIGRMRSIAFSPDGTLAAAGSDSGKVVVWDME